MKKLLFVLCFLSMNGSVLSMDYQQEQQRKAQEQQRKDQEERQRNASMAAVFAQHTGTQLHSSNISNLPSHTSTAATWHNMNNWNNKR